MIEAKWQREKEMQTKQKKKSKRKGAASSESEAEFLDLHKKLTTLKQETESELDIEEVPKEAREEASITVGSENEPDAGTVADTVGSDVVKESVQTAPAQSDLEETAREEQRGIFTHYFLFSILMLFSDGIANPIDTGPSGFGQIKSNERSAERNAKQPGTNAFQRGRLPTTNPSS